MHRLQTALLVLVLGTSCLPRTTALRLEPSAAVAGRPDAHASALALLDRVATRHGLAANEVMRSGCAHKWNRRVARSSRFGPPSAELTLCVDDGVAGVLEIRIIESVVAPRKWSPAADSLRRELADSLPTFGRLAVRDQ